MIAGIELGKKFAQISVKTDLMKEPESITLVVGTEEYRIPIEADFHKQAEIQEVFRRLWKMILPYGDKEPLEYLVFCLEECGEEIRKMLLEIAKGYEISPERVKFIDKNESFCTYVVNQGAELLARNALLIENVEGEKYQYILHKQPKVNYAVMRVHNVSEKSLEQVFKSYGISSVFLVGDDFEEDWMKQNMKLLKNGKRVFAGKNLFVKGACYKGMELKEEKETYLYLDEQKVGCDIFLKTVQEEKEEYFSVVKGGKNWYESAVSMELLLLEEPVLEFLLEPIGGGTKKEVEIPLKDLPKRPKKTTRIRMKLEFTDSCHGKLSIRDLGFGELFPASDMKYEGELQWEQ